MNVAFELVAVVGSNRDHQIGETVGESVEFLLYGLFAAALRVLEERDEQEGDDRSQCVDDQLPSVEAAEQEVAGQPQQNDQSTTDEEARMTSELRCRLGKAVEHRQPSTLAVPVRCHVDKTALDPARYGLSRASVLTPPTGV